jgi:hypothetical protein
VKAKPDINETHRLEGIEGVLRRHDSARKYVPKSDIDPQQGTGLPPYPKPWWRDPATIPPRAFLFGRHYQRRTVGATIGAGGRLKTTLAMCEGLGMGIGRDLLTGDQLAEPLRVWDLNAEEDQDELDRRLAATCQHYSITKAMIAGRLFVQSVCDTPLRIATTINGVATLNRAVLDYLRTFILENKIDVFMLDPWISFHGVRESDNADMDLAIKEGLGAIAKATNSHCEIFHHPGKPKPGADVTTVEDSRGASAIIWAVRSARVLNFMTGPEATQLGILEADRRRYIRVANGKANMAPIGTANWLRIETENLVNGDEVACSSSWKPKNPFDGLTSRDVELARTLAQTGAYRNDVRSPEWFGFALAQHLKIPIKYKADNAPADLTRVKAIMKTWIKNNVLAIEIRIDENRREREYIVLGNYQDGSPNVSYDSDDMAF